MAGDSLKVEAEADVVVGPLFIPDGPMASQNLQEGETEGNVTVYGNSKWGFFSCRTNGAKL